MRCIRLLRLSCPHCLAVSPCADLDEDSDLHFSDWQVNRYISAPAAFCFRPGARSCMHVQGNAYTQSPPAPPELREAPPYGTLRCPGSPATHTRTNARTHEQITRARECGGALHPLQFLSPSRKAATRAARGRSGMEAHACLVPMRLRASVSAAQR